MDDITPSDLKRGRRLKLGAVAAPIVLTTVPALVTLLLMLFAAPSPPTAFLIFIAGIVATSLCFVAGITATGVLAYKHSRWTREMRELIAADGIRAEEINWFRNELRSNEKRALKAVEARDLMLGDAYRETLASRLTATRIVRSSRQEMATAKRRQNKLKMLKNVDSGKFAGELESDVERLTKINGEAKTMLSEAEARLQMIEAAASRGGSIADSELTLKKLSARASELPLALESAKMADEIRIELDKEDTDAEKIFSVIKEKDADPRIT